MFQVEKENIKKILNKKRWSITCQRLLEFLSGKSIEKIFIVCTRDFNFLSRNHSNRYEYLNDCNNSSNIGCKQFGKNSNSYIYCFTKEN